jgi:RecB family exonuclease
MSASDRNRAALQAQLLQQGFGQAQQAAQQDFLRQQQLAAGQMGLAQAAPALAGQQISALTTLGGLQQSQEQALASARQQLAQQQYMQPLQATQALGSGITSLIAGYPGSQQVQTQPSPTPLQTALGAGATLAGVYRAFN